ncbi:MAG TPA: hypothetical protein VK446_16420 [Methylocystis sp.]|nr:hypothetical protein [Methylocystis sp.]
MRLDALVQLVMDRADRPVAPQFLERLLHPPQLLGADHRLKRRPARVRAQDEHAVEFGVVFRLGAIDDEAGTVRRREKPLIALVADERLVALGDLLFERDEQRGPRGCVLLWLRPSAARQSVPETTGLRKCPPA